jgi:predicted ABC-type ATPase
VENTPYLRGRRLRLFGGPNGSGKSTILNQIRSTFDVGKYINADDIEQLLIQSGQLDLHPYGLIIDDPQLFHDFVRSHSITAKARQEGFEVNLKAIKSTIYCPLTSAFSYEAALIADYIRGELLAKGTKLTFESVMSHPSKLDVLDFANVHGYKTYLYFICTESPQINIERVKLRVKEGGHHVDEERILKRYTESLSLLKGAVQRTYRSFIWDNSQKEPCLILEVYKGREVTFLNDIIPDWVNQYLLKN